MRPFLPLLAFLAIVFAVLGPDTAPAAEKRVALVIGNAAYTGLKPLPNPGIDAESLTAALGGAGFEVISCDGKRPGCFDLTRQGMQKAIGTLKAKSTGAALAFVFYAGHGMESGRDNVLVPVDASIDCKTHRLSRSVLLGEMLEALEGAKQKIIVLDACRNNPLPQVCPPLAAPPTLSFRDFKIPDAGNFLLFSSTKPGQVAFDGVPGKHSPFANALLTALGAVPNVHFHQLFDRTAKAVIQMTTLPGAGITPQVPEMLVRGGAPDACLSGKSCGADPRAAALRAEVEDLKRQHARDQELGEAARITLARIETARGKPLTDEERRRVLTELQDAGRALVARNDDRGERALASLKAGDTAAAERLFEEDMKAREAEAAAELRRAAERAVAQRRKAAEAARHLAALARAKSVAKAADYFRKATELAPDDAKTWDDYARAAQEAGRMAEAKAAFAEAARLAGAKGDAYTEYWATLGLGDVAIAQGSLPEALRQYRTAQGAAERAAKSDRNNAGWQRDLSVSYNKVGDVLVAQGNLPEALKSFRDSLSIRERLAKADPNNAGWQRDLAVSHAKLAGVHLRAGGRDQALAALRQGLAIMERMAKLSPDNARWQQDVIWFQARIAELNRPDPYGKERGAIQSAFEVGEFGKAAKLQGELVRTVEKAEKGKGQKAGPATANELLALSWYRLFAHAFEGAQAASERAMAIAPNTPAYATNKAHALMFLGQAQAARAFYTRYKGRRVAEGGKLWEEVILEDFAELEKRGLKHRQMTEVRTLLGGGKATQ